MNVENEESSAESANLQRVVMRLNHQYITRNDGRGRNGLCRVSSGDLLDLLHYVEKMTAHPPSRHCMCEACKPSFEDA
jgi:hypothetical protein